MKNTNSIISSLKILIFALTITPFIVKSQTGKISNLDVVNGFKIFKFNDPISKHISYLKADTSIKKNVHIKSYDYKKQDLTISNLPILSIKVDFLYGKLYHINIMIDKLIKVDDFEKLHLLGLQTAFDYLNDDLIKAFGQATGQNNEVEFGSMVDWNTVWETQNIKLNKCEIHNMIFDKEKYVVCIIDFYYKPTVQKVNLLDFK